MRPAGPVRSPPRPPLPTARARFVAFRRALPPQPRRTRAVVRARGLDFAVWTTPPVPGATPLVCVNGGLLYDHRSLWPTLSPLAARRQLVFYDQRGRGASSAPPGVRAARLEHDAGDLPLLRTALGIDRWDVLGHSWGGGIAMLAAAQDADAVRRLVLVNPVGITSAEWMPGLHAAALAHLAAGNPEARPALAALDPIALVEPDPSVHAAYAAAFFPAWFVDPSLVALMPVPDAAGASATGAAIAARLRREGYDWSDRLRDLRVPTLVVHGGGDLLPAAMAARTAAHLGAPAPTILPDVGHMPFWEAPTPFFDAVGAFLDAP